MPAPAIGMFLLYLFVTVGSLLYFCHTQTLCVHFVAANVILYFTGLCCVYSFIPLGRSMLCHVGQHYRNVANAMLV